MRDIVLPCKAVGDPPPTIKWLKGKYVRFMSSSHLNVENSSTPAYVLARQNTLAF